MKKKNETILIRLDADTKDKFRHLCESQDITMTDMLLGQINTLLLDVQSKNEPSDLFSLIKEKDFYKEELIRYKQTYLELNKTLLSLQNSSLYKQNKLYSELFLDNFNRIKQFNGYELISNHEVNRHIDFIAINKITGIKLLIDFRTGSLSEILIGPRGKHYKLLCDQFKGEEEVKLVIVDLNSYNQEHEKKIEKLQQKIGYEIIIYAIDDLFEFLTQ